MSAILCVQCGEVLPPRGKSGPARRYCSGRCRQAALRDRQSAIEWDAWQNANADVDLSKLTVAAVEPLPALLAEIDSAPPEDQLARAVLETKTLAETYHRLGHETGPNLAWRATRMGDTLTAALRRYFQQGDPHEQ